MKKLPRVIKWPAIAYIALSTMVSTCSQLRSLSPKDRVFPKEINLGQAQIDSMFNRYRQSSELASLKIDTSVYFPQLSYSLDTLAQNGIVKNFLHGLDLERFNTQIVRIDNGETFVSSITPKHASSSNVKEIDIVVPGAGGIFSDEVLRQIVIRRDTQDINGYGGVFRISLPGQGLHGLTYNSDGHLIAPSSSKYSHLPTAWQKSIEDALLFLKREYSGLETVNLIAQSAGSDPSLKAMNEFVQRNSETNVGNVVLCSPGTGSFSGTLKSASFNMYNWLTWFGRNRAPVVPFKGWSSPVGSGFVKNSGEFKGGIPVPSTVFARSDSRYSGYSAYTPTLAEASDALSSVSTGPLSFTPDNVVILSPPPGKDDVLANSDELLQKQAARFQDNSKVRIHRDPSVLHNFFVMNPKLAAQSLTTGNCQ